MFFKKKSEYGLVREFDGEDLKGGLVETNYSFL